MRKSTNKMKDIIIRIGILLSFTTTVLLTDSMGLGCRNTKSTHQSEQCDREQRTVPDKSPRNATTESKSNNKERTIVKIHIRDRSDIQKLANMGIDIWEVGEKQIVASIRKNELGRINELGYRVEVLFGSEQEYYRFIQEKYQKQE